jgi:multiple sugar transport system ATP-binding protein
MIYVTHDQVEAMTLADRTGTVGTAAASEVTEALSGGGSVRCLVDGSRATAGDKVTLGIRPEHFEISSAHAGAQNALPARVTFVETLGSATVAYCEYPGVAEPLTCELDGRVRPRSGDTVTLGVPASVAYLFDAGGRSIRRLAPGQLEQCAA